MQIAIDHFDANLTRIRDLDGLYLALRARVEPALKLSDLLRTEIVMVVSALDHYVHEITRLGMMEVAAARRPMTDAFGRFTVALNGALNRSGQAPESWVGEEVRRVHQRATFQQPHDVANAIRLFHPRPLWPEVAQMVACDAGTVKQHLGAIVRRRNQIVHEADIDPSYPGTRWPIAQPDVVDSVAFIEDIVHAIHSVVT